MDDQSKVERRQGSANDEANAEELRARYLDELNRHLGADPASFRTSICQSVLDWPSSESRGDQDDRWQAHADVRVRQDRERFTYIADLLMRQHRGETTLPLAGFVSVAQWVEDCASLSTDLMDLRVRFDSAYAGDVWRSYFSEFEDDLSTSVSLATELIYQGVPPYVPEARSQGYRLLPRSSPLFHYLYMRGKHFDHVPRLNLPKWASEVFFRVEDLNWHRRFFDSLETDDAVETVERRNGLLRQLGLPPIELVNEMAGVSGWPWGDHDTELLRRLKDAAKRFWTNFDPTDPGTAPLSADVSAWLQERGVAARTAEVIASILRADGLPTGPRK